jgi:hypothetical protein
LEQYAALALDGTTATVKADKGSSTNSSSSSNSSTDPPALTYPQVGLVWRALAQGQVIWRDIKSILEMEEVATATATTTTTTTSEAATAESSSLELKEQDKPQDDDAATDDDNDDDGAHSLVYGPGNCQLDLVESVLLRHAHYPGHWDASQESLWTIFPATFEHNNNKGSATTQKSSSSGDEGWLTEIRDSIATATTTTPASLSMQTPDAKKKGTGDGSGGTVEQTPDAGATDFFKSLLG